MNGTSPTQQAIYRPDIDGLRAVAILAVVAYHVGVPGVTGGFVGVDVFFVISGFLITRLLLKEVESTGRLRFAAFLARRVRRLLPAFFVVALATLAISALTMFPQELPRLGKSATAAALISSNVHFLKFSGGYFDTATDLMPFLHTWSLGVEEQYYLIWPLLLLLVGRLAPRASGPFVVLFSVIFIVSFGANLGISAQHASAVFYLTPFRAWEFVLGGALVLIEPCLEYLPTWIGETLFVAGVALILGAVMMFGDSSAYSGRKALVPTIGASAVIAGGCVSAAQWPTRLLGSRPMVRIGLLSYSWYLWHWPLLSLVRAHELGTRVLVRDLGVVIVALALSWMTYRVVEAPIRFKRPWVFQRTQGTLFAGAAMIVIVIVAASVVIEYGKSQSGRLVKLAEAVADSGKAVHLDKCRPGEPFGRVGPNSTSDCSIGQPDSPIVIAAWGDSHIGHWSPLFAADAGQLRSRILVRVSPTCPPLVGAVPYKGNKGLVECGVANDEVLGEIRELAASGDLKGVVIAARWNEYLARQETDPGAITAMALAERKVLDGSGEGKEPVGIAPYDHSGSAVIESKSLRQTVEALSQLGLRVLIVAPVPELYFHGPQCLYLRSSEQCVVPRTRVVERRRAALEAITFAAQGMDNVRVWDPIDEFCDHATCYTKRDGLLQYTDHNHVAPGKAVRLREVVHPNLSWLAGGNGADQ